METQAGGLGLSESDHDTSSSPWEPPAPARPRPVHQAGQPKLLHPHPGAHPSSCHMLTTQISQQLPPPRSLPLTLGKGGEGGTSTQEETPSTCSADHFLLRGFILTRLPLRSVFINSTRPQRLPQSAIPGLWGAQWRDISRDREAATWIEKLSLV